MLLYRVALETFNVLHISGIVLVGSAIRFLAMTMPFLSNEGGLPPSLPLALAAFSPA